MSDLNAKIVADLKRELAEARAEIEQQRTRAEAAEQELREQHAAYIAPMSDKLAAIRAHLAGVDVSALSELHKTAEATPNAWLAFYMASAPVAQALLAAAREALEP